MQDKIVTLILRQAAEAEGSTQALASRLNAPEATLLRWMSGRAQTPLRAFLAVLEFLMQLERKDGERLPMPAAADERHPDKLVFPLGPLLARCVRCDSNEFRLAKPGSLRLTSPLVCTACGAEVVHGNLLAQLAMDAVHHSRALAARTRRAVDSSRERTEHVKQRLEDGVVRVRPVEGTK